MPDRHRLLENELRSFVKSVRRRYEPSGVTGQMGREALRIALEIIDRIRAANRRLL